MQVYCISSSFTLSTLFPSLSNVWNSTTTALSWAVVVAGLGSAPIRRLHKTWEVRVTLVEDDVIIQIPVHMATFMEHTHITGCFKISC